MPVATHQATNRLGKALELAARRGALDRAECDAGLDAAHTLLEQRHRAALEWGDARASEARDAAAAAAACEACARRVQPRYRSRILRFGV